jgi:hypothetical protein
VGANRGLIANQQFLGQRVRGTYFFAGNWNYAPPGGEIQQFYETVPVAPNDGNYTIHPSDTPNLGWSESMENRAFALQAMVSAGVNTVVMSYWGELNTDRWAFSAPMQTAIGAHNELFDALSNHPLLIMPAIESALATPDCQSYIFSEDFPGTPSNPAPGLVTQVLDLIGRYLQNPQKPEWAVRWLQLFDRDGVPRFALNLLHVASSQVASDAGQVFAAGFEWVADLVFNRTGIRVGFTLDALPVGQTIYQSVSDRGGWAPWFVPRQTTAAPGAAVTAVWANENHLDLFTVSVEGAVISTFWDKNQTPNYPADGWFTIRPEMQFSGPGAMAAVWANENHLDLFAVNRDQMVATISWEPTGYRADGWLLIDPNTQFQAGTPVTAIWANEDHLDLFAVGADGIIRTIFWDKSEPAGYRAGGWITLHPETRSVAGGHVTALWGNKDHLDLFVVTADEAVSTLWWDRSESAGYNPAGWLPIGDERRFKPGAKVAALWAPREDVQHLDLFTVDATGIVSSIWWDSDPGTYRPEGWFTIPGQVPVALQAGSEISASWISDQELLLLLSAADGTVSGANWIAKPGWQGWFSIRSEELKAFPGAAITAVLSPDPNQLDVFTTDPNGTVHSTYYRFNVNDTFVATAGSAGQWLEQTPSVLAIQGFIPEVYSGGDDNDRFDAKASYWNNWRSSGLPVFWDVEPGYDGHLVFPGSKTWGNNATWRIFVQESWEESFCGMVYNTWNGYTEGYAAVRTLEYGDIVANWVWTLFRRVT